MIRIACYAALCAVPAACLALAVYAITLDATMAGVAALAGGWIGYNAGREFDRGQGISGRTGGR